MNKRLSQLDFLKCICIVLMVTFHFVYIEEKYPYAMDVVYTFHMPVFLIISGYLTNNNRSFNSFLRKQWWLFVPYILVELPYVVFSGVMGVRWGETDLSIPNLLYRIFVNPMGPYWYLHTLIICNISSWCVEKLFGRLGIVVEMMVLSFVLSVLVYGTHIVSASVYYYFFGIVIAKMGIQFLQIFHPSFWAIFPAIYLCCFPMNLHCNTIGGMAITILFICFMMWLYEQLSPALRKPILFIGRNTLVILLFSPIFTMAVKPLTSILSFDSTGLLFLTVSLIITISGCLFIAWLIDKMHCAKYFFGKEKLLCR